MEPRQIWCERAMLPSGVERDVLISVDDGVVTAIEIGVAATGADQDRHDGLMLPGFANAHSHAFHRALRSRTHRSGGDFWTWREQMYAVAGRLTPDNYRELARATFAEMVLAGYTVVGEFHYVHHDVDGEPYDDPNEMGSIVIRAAEDAGIRLTLLDACYLRAGAGQPLTSGQARFSDGTADAWTARVGALRTRTADTSKLVRIGAAIHSVRAVDAPSIAQVADFARQCSMPLHAHVSEQLSENEQADSEFGCSPTAILAKAEALSGRFTAVHATHVSDADIDLYARAGSSCCLCPTTERDLADGIGPSVELRDRGVELSIGSDQHCVTDPFEEMRAIEMNERLRSMRRGRHDPLALLRAGTRNGYRSLGWPRGGVIAIGAPADLTSVSLSGSRLAGSPESVLPDAVVFAATSDDVDTVIVAGRTIVRDGRHTTIDVPVELGLSIAAVYGETR